MKTRTETDSIWSLDIPVDAPRGIYTQRVLNTYPYSVHVPVVFLRSYIEAKMIYATVNSRAGKLDEKIMKAIHTVGEELLKLDDEEFLMYMPIWQIQSGGGTSTNMMINEVMANLASKQLWDKFWSWVVNAHDHLNLSQSSNDTFPWVMKISCIKLLAELLEDIDALVYEFKKHEEQRKDIQKVGRTHLQDAVVITLGEEMWAYARCLEKSQVLLVQSLDHLLELPFWWTATGSLQNITPEIREDLIEEFSEQYDMPCVAPVSYFEQNSSSADMMVLSHACVHLANNLIKIWNDLRLLSSWPLAWLWELSLPVVQPWSSIMPGKVNPSIVEAMTMICAKVIGNNETINVLSRMSQLQLQFLNPCIARSIIDSLEQLIVWIQMFTTQCVSWILPNTERIGELLEWSFAYATDYSEKLWYETVARLVKKALKQKVNLRELLDAEMNNS